MKKQGFTLIELLVVISIIALLIGILLPALGAARRTARQMQSNTQIRGIHQSMFTFSQSNRDYFPGLSSKAKVEQDDATANNGFVDGLSGATVEYRFAEMLTNDFFTGEYAVSPVETKDIWTDPDIDDIDSLNFSYAMLRVHDEVSVTTSVAANQGQRANVWKGDLDTETILLTDRAKVNTTGQLYSIHTSPPEGSSPQDDWRGSVAWADNHVSFETTDALDTNYGSGPAIQGDKIFNETQTTDVISTTSTWDDNANAQMDASETDTTAEAVIEQP